LLGSLLATAEKVRKNWKKWTVSHTIVLVNLPPPRPVMPREAVPGKTTHNGTENREAASDAVAAYD
jgi:hypothetical protein